MFFKVNKSFPTLNRDQINNENVGKGIINRKNELIKKFILHMRILFSKLLLNLTNYSFVTKELSR